MALKERPRLPFPWSPATVSGRLPLAIILPDTLHMHNTEAQLGNHLCLVTLSRIHRPPAFSFNAVNAAGSIRTRGDVIQVCAHHARAAGARAIDLGGGVKQALVSQLLAPKCCSNSGRKVDVALVRLIHLWLVGEQDLGFWTAKEMTVVKLKEERQKVHWV